MATVNEPSAYSGSRNFFGMATLLSGSPTRDGHADQAVQLVGEAGRCAEPPVKHELADAERAGLVLVEAQARDELARKGLQLACDCFARGAERLGRDSLRRLGLRDERQHVLDRRRLRRRDVERACDRDREVLSAPAEHACELTDAAV